MIRCGLLDSLQISKTLQETKIKELEKRVNMSLLLGSSTYETLT
jgi:hypothetical protein